MIRPAGEVCVVGIVGGSASGKTTLAVALLDRLGPGRAARLSEDSYYRDLSALPPGERSRRNFDRPEAIDFPRLARDLAELKAGRRVVPPRYDMRSHTRRGTGVPVAPAPVILVDGILLLADPETARLLDRVVFVELPERERLARRLARDVALRGRTEEEVRERWERQVLPMHAAYVAPARARADLVVPGDGSPARNAERVARALGLG